MSEQRCKYMREDFGDLPVTLHHLAIYLNFNFAVWFYGL